MTRGIVHGISSMNLSATMRHPDCCKAPKYCRIRSLGGFSTAVAWTPLYDGDGNLLNVDPNTHRHAFACDACGREWVRVVRGGIVTFESSAAEPDGQSLP